MSVARAIAVILFFSTLVVAQQKTKAIPFTTNSDGMVIIPVTLESNVPAHVILDTGAGVDVLAPSLIAKLGGKPAGVFSAFRMTGERLDIDLYTIPEIAIGPMVMKDALVAAWKVLDDLHLDGIISLSDFRQQPVTIDFIHHEVVLDEKDALAQRAKYGIEAPLRFDDLRGTSIDSFTLMLVDGLRMECELDTGSPSATINERYMTGLKIDRNSAGVKKVVKKNVVGVDVTRYDTTIAKIALASSSQVSLQNAPVSFENIIYDCVLGVDFWKGRAVTFDIANHRLIVSTQ